jgi:predicted nucleotidyltransferase component of viral defense system
MLHFDAVPDNVRNLLILLSPLPALKGFSLGGGTSLALRFGHRLSVDLDFFTTEEFDPEQLADRLGLSAAIQVNRALNSLILDMQGTKLDFLRHAYPLLGASEEIEGVRLLSLPDVAAMKLNAAANRGAKKDFFDLCELQRHQSLPSMLEWFETKYRTADRFTVIRSLGWFEDAELEPDPIPLNGDDWKMVKAKLRSMVSHLT